MPLLKQNCCCKVTDNSWNAHQKVESLISGATYYIIPRHQTDGKKLCGKLLVYYACINVKLPRLPQQTSKWISAREKIIHQNPHPPYSHHCQTLRNPSEYISNPLPKVCIPTHSVLSIWQVPSPGLTKTDLGLAILLNS